MARLGAEDEKRTAHACKCFHNVSSQISSSYCPVDYRVKAIQYDITFFQALASPSLATREEQAHAIKIHPRIIKKLPRMASRGTLQTPSEPLGDPFGHSPYFKTLLDVIFRHFGSTLASLGALFWKPFGLLCLSWGFQETKIDEF